MQLRLQLVNDDLLALADAKDWVFDVPYLTTIGVMLNTP